MVAPYWLLGQFVDMEARDVERTIFLVLSFTPAAISFLFVIKLNKVATFKSMQLSHIILYVLDVWVK